MRESAGCTPSPLMSGIPWKPRWTLSLHFKSTLCLLLQRLPPSSRQIRLRPIVSRLEDISKILCMCMYVQCIFTWAYIQMSTYKVYVYLPVLTTGHFGKCLHSLLSNIPSNLQIFPNLPIIISPIKLRKR